MFSKQEIAKEMNVTAKWIENWLYNTDERVEGYKVGSSVMFDKENADKIREAARAYHLRKKVVYGRDKK